MAQDFSDPKRLSYIADLGSGPERIRHEPGCQLCCIIHGMERSAPEGFNQAGVTRTHLHGAGALQWQDPKDAVGQQAPQFFQTAGDSHLARRNHGFAPIQGHRRGILRRPLLGLGSHPLCEIVAQQDVVWKLNVGISHDGDWSVRNVRMLPPKEPDLLDVYQPVDLQAQALSLLKTLVPHRHCGLVGDAAWLWDNRCLRSQHRAKSANYHGVFRDERHTATHR
jgi:hypothetical protein